MMLILGLAAAAYLMMHRPGSALKDLPGIERKERPVLLITMDTTRRDHVGPYGCTDVKTPVLDRIAEHGIVFENAFAVAPLTLPAHTSINTGLLPPHTGVRNNGIHYAKDELTTLAEKFKEKGFRTAAFVSAAVLSRHYGLSQGFDVYDDDLSTSSIRAPGVVPDRPAVETVKAAEKWLDTLEDGDKYFLWVHFYDPHSVYNPPPPFRDTYRDRLYDGEIAYMDSQIGKLLEHPRLSGEDEPIIVLIGDHGESLGEHGEQSHGILAYDATLHVPWIMRIPEGPEGLRIKANVMQVDVAPTLLDLEGFKKLKECDGISVFAAVGMGGLKARPIYSECYLPYYSYGWSKLRILRQGSMKLIDCPEAELYDLERDPKELTNMIDQLEYQAHDLRVAMKDLLGEDFKKDKEAQLEVDQESAQQLMALGYLAVSNVGTQPDSERPIPMKMIDVHVILEKSRFLRSNRMFDEVKKLLHKLLERDPRNLAALTELASCYQDSGDIEGALKITERALGFDPKNTNFLFTMANLEVQKGDVKKALEILDTIISIDPKRIDVSVRKAQLYSRTGRMEEAQEQMKSVMETDGENAVVLVAYVQLVDLPSGDTEQAKIHLQKAIDRDPFFDDAWRMMAKMYEVKGNNTKAIEMYTEGLKKTPDSESLHGGLGLLLARLEQGEKARRHIEEAIRLSNRFQANYHLTLGALLAEEGHKKEAEEQYELVLKNAPDNPGAKNNKALALLQSGKIDQASKLLEDLVRDFPTYVDALNNLSAIALVKGQWKSAEKWARQSVEAGPESVDGWNNLGYALMKQKSYSDAEKSLIKALEINPEHWQAELNMGTLLMETKRPEEAEKVLVKLSSELPSLADPHYLLGSLYLDYLNDPASARKQFSMALKLDPRGERAKKAKAALLRIPNS